MPFRPGDSVHVTTLGKAVVREVRNGRRCLVELKGRTMLVAESQLIPLDAPERRRTSGRIAASAPPIERRPARPTAAQSIDLHGMTVDEALAAVDAFVNDAILASLAEVRIIHGRSGGRLKAAMHARLRQLRPVRDFRVDPRNPGVTLVTL
jgi:DNA mismatch repair protein MutS2